MLLLRIPFSELNYIRVLAPSRLLAVTSIFHSSCIKQQKWKLSSPDINCRTLCNKLRPNYSELIKNDMKFNMAKQILHRGKAATGYQEELLDDFISSHEVATPEEWHELVHKIFDLEFGMINDVNVDGKIVDCCVLSSKLNLARSYLAYMKSQKKKFNGAVVTAYIKVCYKCRDSMIEQDKTRIKQFTDFLQKRYPIADVIICDGIVKGLILQGKVYEALDVVEKTKSMSKPNGCTISAAATALLGIGQHNKAINYIKQNLNDGTSMSDEVYLKWIDVFKDNKEKLINLLEIFRVYDIKPTKLICDHLIVTFKRLPSDDRLIGNYGIVNNRGKCSVCNETLQPLELDLEEFTELGNTFLNNVLVGDDVFKNTTPAELKIFTKLVQSEGPFDIVIDGLNVAYMTGTKLTPLTFVNMIRWVVSHYREQDMKVLVIGRKHMKQWPNFLNMMKDLECHYFLIDDLSEDDPFMLYATMFSGINARFVSRDLMRSQICLLQCEKKMTLFKRWQQARQIFITYVSPTGRLYTRHSLNFQMCAQRSKDGGWHIPCIEDQYSPEDEYGIHRKWLCLEKYSEKHQMQNQLR